MVAIGNQGVTMVLLWVTKALLRVNLGCYVVMFDDAFGFDCMGIAISTVISLEECYASTTIYLFSMYTPEIAYFLPDHLAT